MAVPEATVTLNGKTGPNQTVNTTIRRVSSVNINWAAGVVDITYEDGKLLSTTISELVSLVTTNTVDTFTLS